jgi:hypothetical protein
MQNSIVKEVIFIPIDLISVRLFISYLPSIILITVTPHYFIIYHYSLHPLPSTAAPEEMTLELSSVVSPVSGNSMLGILLAF